MAKIQPMAYFMCRCTSLIEWSGYGSCVTKIFIANHHAICGCGTSGELCIAQDSAGSTACNIGYHPEVKVFGSIPCIVSSCRVGLGIIIISTERGLGSLFP